MQTEMMPKDLMFKLRLEERDRQRLDAIAAHYEMTAAQTVRQLLKEKSQALGLDTPSPAELLTGQPARDDLVTPGRRTTVATMLTKKAKKPAK